MKTLKTLAKEFSNAPVMMAAIRRAIAQCGEHAMAIIVIGSDSTGKRSNIYYRAASLGWKNFVSFAGSRAGRNKTAGYHNIVVRRAAR